jgi:hypothetical protein
MGSLGWVVFWHGAGMVIRDGKPYGEDGSVYRRCIGWLVLFGKGEKCG